MTDGSDVAAASVYAPALALAERQHGVVTRAQLLAGGLGVARIKRLARAGWLRPLHRGVYQVGPVRSRRTREMAALLACGEGATLSHRSAAAAWGLLDLPTRSAAVEVTVPSGRHPRRPRIRVHRGAALDPIQSTVLDRLRVTTPARTIVDLAGLVTMRRLEQALAKAEREGLADHTEIDAVLGGRERKHGARALRALLESPTDPRFARSPLEEAVLALLASGGLPAPETNVMVAGREVDLFWRDRGFAIELDGLRFHGSRRAQVADRRKDLHLAARGLRVIRLTWDQVHHERDRTLVLIAEALAAVTPR